MNLVVDIGNTFIKYGVFEGNKLKEKHIFPSKDAWNKKILEGKENILICSVHNKEHDLSRHTGKNVMHLSSSIPCPVSNKYHQPETLGPDRLAAAVGAFHFFPNKNVLTIDAGTCIKYNFVNEKDEFMGGAISPGLQMRLRAMHQFTARLPEVEIDKADKITANLPKLIGQSTQEGMISGALIGASCEMDGFIDKFTALYPDITVLLTGGDAPFLSRQIRNKFFAEPDLTLIGLNRILQYHREN